MSSFLPYPTRKKHFFLEVNKRLGPLKAHEYRRNLAEKARTYEGGDSGKGPRRLQYIQGFEYRKKEWSREWRSDILLITRSTFKR